MASMTHYDEDYLKQASKLLVHPKHLSFKALKLKKRQRVLDVGCGLGQDVAQMVPQVGKQGRVVGLDCNPAFLDAARQRTATLGKRARFVEGDATDMPFPRESFDACRCERVLQHLAEPQQAIGEMVRVTKPGGRIVILDTDWGTASIDTAASTHVERVLTRVRAERCLANGYAGRMLYRLGKAVGLHSLTVKVVPLVIHQYPLARYLGMLDIAEQAALDHGELSLDEVTAWREELSAADAAGRFFGTIALTLVTGLTP
ncbi:MAG TPA: methyltransferase domain-containing protein [Ktedonobacterales bacterium]